MKKILLFFVTAFLFGLHLQAQITLNQSNTSYVPCSVSAAGASLTGFTLPTIGANQQWNYSNLTQSSLSGWGSIVPSNTNFPTATFQDTTLSANFVPGWYYYYDAFYETDASGEKYLGYTVQNLRTGLLSVTGNALDSCIFPAQIYTYSTPLCLMPFPTTMSTSWYANYRNVVNFNLTISAYSLNHTPCQKVSLTSRQDTVIGWGKMRVPTASGPSYAYDVLMVKRSVVQVDSFYMSGAPAPQALLTAFGVTQGQSTITNRYLFWRQNAYYPLMLVNFGSNNYTSAAGVYYDATAVFDPSGIEENEINTSISVFPNPASEKLFVNSDCKVVDYTIYNSVGSAVISGRMVNKFIDINDLPKGIYFTKFTADGLNKTVKFIKD